MTTRSPGAIPATEFDPFLSAALDRAFAGLAGPLAHCGPALAADDDDDALDAASWEVQRSTADLARRFGRPALVAALAECGLIVSAE